MVPIYTDKDDVDAITSVIRAVGMKITEVEAVGIWEDYSEIVGMVWAPVIPNAKFIVQTMLTWGVYLKHVGKWQRLNDRQKICRIYGAAFDINDWEFALLCGPFKAASFAFGLDSCLKYDIIKQIAADLVTLKIESVDRLVEFREIAYHAYDIH